MSANLSKGLVLHQMLDRESLQSATIFADKTPHENKGTSANAPVFTADRMGQADRAMSFDGASDYVDFTPITISKDNGASVVWFKTSTDFSSNYNSIGQILGGGSFGLKYLGVKGDGNTPYSLYGETNVNGEYFTSVGGVVPVGVWNCVISSFDSGEVKTYLNNELIDTKSISNDVTLRQFSGSISSGNVNYFNGSIADVRIYNRALDQTEITMLYDMYRPKLSAGSLQKGLVLDMPLTSTYTKDETAGAEVMTDRTPYSNDGQNSGGDVDTDHTTFISANSDNVRIPDSESLSSTSTMTAMTWVKGAEQNAKGFLAHWDANNQRGFQVTSYSSTSPYNKFRIYISDDGTWDATHRKSYISSIVAFDNIWHLVGFTFDAGTLKLFIDGAEDTNCIINTDSAITTIHNSTADVMVGCSLSSDTPANFFDGDISGAKIWDRALGAEEILSLFDKGMNV